MIFWIMAKNTMHHVIIADIFMSSWMLSWPLLEQSKPNTSSKQYRLTNKCVRTVSSMNNAQCICRNFCVVQNEWTSLYWKEKEFWNIYVYICYISISPWSWNSPTGALYPSGLTGALNIMMDHKQWSWSSLRKWEQM